MEKLKDYLTVDGWKKDLEETINRFGVERDIDYVKEILQKYHLTPKEVFGENIANMYDYRYFNPGDSRAKRFLKFKHDETGGILKISGIYSEVALNGTQDEDTGVCINIPKPSYYKFVFSRNLR